MTKRTGEVCSRRVRVWNVVGQADSFNTFFHAPLVLVGVFALAFVLARDARERHDPEQYRASGRLTLKNSPQNRHCKS
jgi:hypothetical protein